MSVSQPICATAVCVCGLYAAMHLFEIGLNGQATGLLAVALLVSLSIMGRKP